MPRRSGHEWRHHAQAEVAQQAQLMGDRGLLLLLLPPPLGVLGHEGSAVIVGLNGLRLLRRGVWNRALRAASTR